MGMTAKIPVAKGTGVRVYLDKDNGNFFAVDLDEDFATEPCCSIQVDGIRSEPGISNCYAKNNFYFLEKADFDITIIPNEEV